MTYFGNLFGTRTWLAAAMLTLVLAPTQGSCAAQVGQVSVNLYVPTSRTPVVGEDQTADQTKTCPLTDRTVTMSLDNVPLDYCIQSLKEYLENVDISIDEAAINQAAIPMDQTVSFVFTQAPLKLTLDHILKPSGLTYVVQDNTIVITVPEPGHLAQCTPPSSAPAESSCPVLQWLMAFAPGKPQQGQAYQPAVVACPHGVCTGVSTMPCCPVDCPASVKAECGCDGCCKDKDCCALQALAKGLSNITFSIEDKSSTTERKITFSVTNVDLKQVIGFVQNLLGVSDATGQGDCCPQAKEQQGSDLILRDQAAITLIPGWSGVVPACALTPGLAVPITASSFGYALPPFGGCPGTIGPDCAAINAATASRFILARAPQYGAACRTCPAGCSAGVEILPQPTICPVAGEKTVTPEQCPKSTEYRGSLECQNEQLRQLIVEQQRTLQEMQAMMREFTREVTAMHREMLVIRLNQAAQSQPPYNIPLDPHMWTTGPMNSSHFVPGAPIWGMPLVPTNGIPDRD